MLQVNISSLKNSLSAILSKVKTGKDVLIMERNTPVAKISHFTSSHSNANSDEEIFLSELEKKGIVERPKRKMPSAHDLEKNLIKIKGSAVKALLDEREESPF